MIGGQEIQGVEHVSIDNKLYYKVILPKSNTLKLSDTAIQAVCKSLNLSSGPTSLLSRKGKERELFVPKELIFSLDIEAASGGEEDQDNKGTLSFPNPENTIIIRKQDKKKEDESLCGIHTIDFTSHYEETSQTTTYMGLKRAKTDHNDTRWRNPSKKPANLLIDNTVSYRCLGNTKEKVTPIFDAIWGNTPAEQSPTLTSAALEQLDGKSPPPSSPQGTDKETRTETASDRSEKSAETSSLSFEDALLLINPEGNFSEAFHAILGNREVKNIQTEGKQYTLSFADKADPKELTLTYSLKENESKQPVMTIEFLDPSTPIVWQGNELLAITYTDLGETGNIAVTVEKEDYHQETINLGTPQDVIKPPPPPSTWDSLFG
jgi:hypothetical protein